MAPVPAPARAPASAAALVALARLDASRRRLKQTCMPDGPDRGVGAAGRPTRLGAWWRLARRSLAGHPLAAGLMHAVARTWRRHPLRPGLEIMAHEVSVTLVPAVRRHPLASVAAAAALSAAVVALRPWRWAWVAAAWSPWRGRALVGAVRHAMAACADVLVRGRPLG